MCGALTTSAPSGSSSAQEKSSRSFTFVEIDVRWSISPISPAMLANRFVKSSCRTASGRGRSRPFVPAGVAALRRAIRPPTASASARQPGSITHEVPRSKTRAGPSTRAPGSRSSRRWSDAVLHAPAKRTRAVCFDWAGVPKKGSGVFSASARAERVPVVEKTPDPFFGSARADATTRSDSNSIAFPDGRWP